MLLQGGAYVAGGALPVVGGLFLLIRELRKSRVEDQIATRYGALVNELQDELQRVRGNQSTISGHTKMLSERLRLLEIEAQVARDDRSKALALLRQVKTVQERMVRSGELHDRLVDIPTSIFTR